MVFNFFYMTPSSIEGPATRDYTNTTSFIMWASHKAAFPISPTTSGVHACDNSRAQCMQLHQPNIKITVSHVIRENKHGLKLYKQCLDSPQCLICSHQYHLGSVILPD